MRSSLIALALLLAGVPVIAECLSNKQIDALRDYEKWRAVCILHKARLIDYSKASLALESFMSRDGKDWDPVQERMSLRLMKHTNDGSECFRLIESFRWFRYPHTSDI